MTEVFNPSTPHYKKLQLQFDSARRKANPSKWLYENNARTTLFMLQSIARLHWKCKGDKTSDKYRLVFKQLEDMLGKIDHYQVLLKEGKENKLDSEKVLKYFAKKSEKAQKKMNELLRQEDFFRKFLSDFGRTTHVNYNDPGLVAALEKEIKNEMIECEDFFRESPEGFDDMELQVHEFRRKLRWASIYSQSLQGIIKLKASKRMTWENKFIDKETRLSPFNILPEGPKLKRNIYYNKNAFFAMSFVIRELGKIKDEGLSHEALIKALRKGEGLDKKEAGKRAEKLLGKKNPHHRLLGKAHALLKAFFLQYKIHRSLI